MSSPVEKAARGTIHAGGMALLRQVDRLVNPSMKTRIALALAVGLGSYGLTRRGQRLRELERKLDG